MVENPCSVCNGRRSVPVTRLMARMLLRDIAKGALLARERRNLEEMGCRLRCPACNEGELPYAAVDPNIQRMYTRGSSW